MYTVQATAVRPPYLVQATAVVQPDDCPMLHVQLYYTYHTSKFKIVCTVLYQSVYSCKCTMVDVVQHA